MKTLIANVKCLALIFVTLLIAFGTQSTSYGQEENPPTLNVSEPRTVRLFYFLPNDRPYRAEVVEAMKTGIVELQTFFAEQMEAHGHGRKTFQLEADDQGELIVHHVDGDYPDSHYISRGYTEGEIDQAFDNSANVAIIVMDLSRKGSIAGHGTGSKSSGWLIVYEGWNWTYVAHELGHAFGLQHDFSDRAYILSYGLPNRSSAKLSACNAKFLAVHPYFNPDIPLEAEQPPTIELISSPEYPAGSESVPIRLRVRDDDGLHQVILFVHPKNPFLGGTPEVKACHGLAGETDTIVEFNFDGRLPSDNVGTATAAHTTLSNTSQHPIYVVAVDMDGNRTNTAGSIRFTLEEGHSPQHITNIDRPGGGMYFYSAAFSPDGTTLAIGTGGGVFLYNALTMEYITFLRHTEGNIYSNGSVVFSPDGTLLASGSADSTIKLWNLATKENIATFEGHTDRIFSVDFSPDGTLLASGSWDSTIKLWNVVTRENTATLEGHTDRIFSVDFLPDGTLASSSTDGTVKLWDVTTKAQIATVETGHTWSTGVAFSPDGTTLATSSGYTSKLWNVATRTHIRTLKGNYIFQSLVFSPDGTIIASSNGSQVHIWDVLTRENIATFSGGPGGVGRLLFSPNGTKLISQGGAAVKFWDVSEWPGQVDDTLETIPVPAISDRTPQVRDAILGAVRLDSPIISNYASITVYDLARITQLSLNDTNINSLKADDFDGLTGLTELRLYDNQLTTLPEGIFDNLNALTRLSLGNNRFTTLPEGIFDNLNSLTRLSLGNNRFTTLPAGIFDNLNSLTTLNLQDNQLTTLPAGIFDNLNSLTTLNLQDNQLTTLPAGIFDNLNSLTWLNLGNNQLTTLPEGIFDNLNSLTTLGLAVNRLTTLPEGIFDNLNSLTWLGLAVNRLTTLPAGIFDNLNALGELHLNGNQLSTLPEGLFDGLSSLARLLLHENTVDPLSLTVSLEKVGADQVKAVAPAGAPFDLVLPLTVGNRDISGGATTLTIPAGSLESQPLTVTRTTGTTNAVTVDIGTLPSLPTSHQGYELVKSADLPLEVMGATATQVISVNIPDANLRAKIESALGKTSGDPITAAEMATLTTLTAQDASISNLTGLETATNLTTLKLGNNTISNISALSGLTNLTELHLWDNQLSNISALAGLTNLTRLYLWGNTISDISHLSGLTSLRQLRIGENNISNISAVSRLTNLTYLSVKENAISDISAVSGLTNLAELVIGNNTISDITPVQNLTNLEWLDMPNNSISDISAVQNLTQLVELYFQNNAVSDLSPLVANTGLGTDDEMDVRGNPLSYPSIYTHIPALQARNVYVDFDNRVATAPVKISGDPQQGNTGATLAQPFIVEVQDGSSVAFAGVPVTFAVTAGGGTLSATNTTTDVNGRAETTLTLGNTAGTNTVSVSVTGITQTITFTATATTTNTAPVFTDGTSTTRTVAENTAAAVNIGTAITATDANNDTLTYTLGGTDASAFTIDNTTGQLKTNALLDYETKATYRVTVSVSDGSLTDTITVTISITDVNEVPTASAICEVGDILAPGESCTYPGTDTEFSVLGNGNGQFLFFTSGSSLNIKGTEINGESYTLVAKKLRSGSWEIEEIADSADNTVPETTNTAPVFTDGTSTTRTIAENTAAGINIGTAITATDADNDTLTYTLGGTDAAAFNVDSNTGQLKTRNALDYETKTTYMVTVTVTDGSLTDTITVTISVTDIADTVVTSTLTPVSERTLQVREAILGVVRLNFPTISGYDAITKSHLSGITTLYLNNQNITSLKAGDFDDLIGLEELRLNNNQLTTLPDGIFNNLTSLTDLNLYNNQLSSLPAGIFEGLTSLTTLRLGRNVVDPLPLTISLQKAGEGQFKAVVPTGAPFDIVLPLSVANGSITGGATTLIISHGSVESDFLTVTATPGTTAAVTVDIRTLPSLPRNHYGYALVKSEDIPLAVISSINTTPTFTEGTSTTRTVAENTAAAVNIGTPIIATDAENDTLTYTLSGTDAASFTIDNTTGQLKTEAALDYETKTTYTVIITVSDGSLTRTITVNINITDIDELPTSTAICKVGDILAPGESCTYPGTDTEFSILGNGNGQFLFFTSGSSLNIKGTEINGESYTLVAKKLNTGSWEIEEIADSADSTAPETTNTAPVFTDGTSTTRAIAENTPASINIGTAITATDAENDTLTYTLSGTDVSAFDIDSTTGQLKTKVVLDYETKRIYTVTITVDDGDLTDTITVIISVIDVNDTVITSAFLPVSDRTPEVRDAIVAEIPGVTTASQVTDAHLAAITALNLRSKGIWELKTGDFSGLTGLTNLNLFNNDLISLPPGIFARLTALTTLRLGGNAVDPLPLIVSLQSVGAGEFKAVITTGAPSNIVLPITVTNGSIRGGITSVTIPQGSAESASFRVISTSTATPTVAFGTLPGLPINHFGYTLAQSTVCNRTEAVAAAIASAVGVSDCSNVTEMDLATITVLDLKNKGISRLKDGDFDGLSALTELRLQENQLTTLPANIFSDLSALEVLYLNNNRLTSLPLTVFSAFSSLEHLYMNNNQLTSLPESVFSGMTSLRQINMHTNRLTTLPVNVFSGLTSLIQFSINNNRLTSLPENVFAGRQKLIYLYLDGNRLTSLPANLFSGLSKLEQLKFNHNRLRSLPAGLFSGLSSLTWLLIHNNTVNPLPLTVSLEKVGTNQFKAITLVGAPFTLTIPITVVNGSISGGATRLTIPAGDVESAPLTVTRTLGTTGAVTVNIGTLPGLPTQHQGYELVKSANLPLTVINALRNNAPVFTDGTSTTRTIAENTAAGVNIGSAVSATDVDNDTLTYSLSGTDASAFDIDTTNGQLQTQAALDYETKTTYTVTITVSDGSLTDTITVTINITDINELPTTTGICKVGDILAPGESCTYPGTDAVFSVLDNGNSKWNIPNLPWFDKVSIGGSMSITADINDENYHFVAKAVADNSWEIEEIGDDTNQQPDTPEQPGDTGGTPTLAASTAAPLTEATLHEGVITLTLSGGTFERSSFSIRDAITLTGITGVTVDTFGVDRVSDTQVTVELAFAGNMTSDSNLTISLGADAIKDYDGAALTAQMSVSAVTESITASTASPLTEATLDESVVTLTLSGRKFERFNSTIRPAVSVSGITGVTVGTFDIDRQNDTEVTVELTFNGNLNTDGTLTFTVGAGAITGYNGPALTAQISVSASDAPVEIDDQSPDPPVDDMPAPTTDTREAFEASTPAGYTRVTLKKTGSVWGIPTKYTSDSDVGIVAYMALAKLTDCNFADAEVARQSIVYIKRQTLGTLSSFVSGTVCGKTSSAWSTAWNGVRITHLRFFDETSLPNIKEAVYNAATDEIEIPSVWQPPQDTNGTQQPGDKDPPEQPDNNTGGTPTLSITTAAPLTEATLHEGVITLNLSGGTFERSSFSIRDAITLSGISGVTVDTFGVDRVSDTKVTVELAFDGNMTTDSTLTISVGAGAIKDYNGTALTSQISVRAITESMAASTASPLTEATLDESIVTLTLNGAKYARSIFDIRGAVSVSGISGVTKPWSQPDRKSDTEVTVELEFDGTDFDTTSTLTFTVEADAIAGYNGPALTTQISVSAVTESVVASTPAPLKEATLDGSVVTLTLSGAKYSGSIWDIRGGVTVSGITGVTIPWNQPDRKSDTQITIELEFDGNMNTDGTLTFTVGANAIENYSGSALTTQVTVTADRENVLLANFPNPFNPETWIPYQLAKPTDVTITIYALNGQVVRTLALGHQVTGMYQNRSRAAYWNGKNEFGEPVASGLYFYTLTAGDFTATRKMLIRK